MLSAAQRCECVSGRTHRARVQQFILRLAEEAEESPSQQADKSLERGFELPMWSVRGSNHNGGARKWKECRDRQGALLRAKPERPVGGCLLLQWMWQSIWTECNPTQRPRLQADFRGSLIHPRARQSTHV